MNEKTKHILRSVGKQILQGLLLIAYGTLYGIGRIAGWLVIGCSGACRWLSAKAKSIG